MTNGMELDCQGITALRAVLPEKTESSNPKEVVLRNGPAVPETSDDGCAALSADGGVVDCRWGREKCFCGRKRCL